MEARRAGPTSASASGSSTLMQPNSLKLTSTLCILKNLHRVAEAIENTYGDKSAEKTYFLSGVQGKVSKPTWSRDYTYFLARVAEVRDHLADNCVNSALEDVAQAALDIYSRFENRRRMGVEIMVLAMLTSKRASKLEVPEKYQSHTSVLDMLVSCRLAKRLFLTSFNPDRSYNVYFHILL